MARRPARKSTDKPRTRVEKRNAQRFTLLLRVGKLVSAAGEFLCVLRDVSTHGLKARLFHPLPEADDWEVELGGGERFAIEPVWQRDCHAGFRFSHGPIDVHALLAEAGPFPKRHIRLRLNPPLPVRLSGEDLDRWGELSDISQHGALVDVEPGLALGREIRLDAPGLPRLHGRVRWRRGSAYGIVFQQGFRLDDLAALSARLQLGEEADLPEARSA